MRYIDPCCFEFLSVAKRIYDSGLMDKVVKNFGNLEVCEDYYSVAWEGIACVFDGFWQFYNEDIAVETMVFTDPVITEFYRLCGLYEAGHGIGKDDDPFRKDCAQDVCECFRMDSYDYDVRLYDGAHGARRMAILTGEEFFGHAELPSVLADVKSTFITYCEKLKRELAAENTGVKTPQNTEQEAA